MLQRRVSIVIFLSSSVQDTEQEGYGGGELAFYGLLKGPHWEDCAFTLDASPGLMIAFRPDVFHEVRPVTFGERLTIVAWFTNDLSPG
jgi:SM-20-related protein